MAPAPQFCAARPDRAAGTTCIALNGGTGARKALRPLGVDARPAAVAVGAAADAAAVSGCKHCRDGSCIGCRLSGRRSTPKLPADSERSAPDRAAKALVSHLLAQAPPLPSPRLTDGAHAERGALSAALIAAMRAGTLRVVIRPPKPPPPLAQPDASKLAAPAAKASARAAPPPPSAGAQAPLAYTTVRVRPLAGGALRPIVRTVAAADGTARVAPAARAPAIWRESWCNGEYTPNCHRCRHARLAVGWVACSSASKGKGGPHTVARHALCAPCSRVLNALEYDALVRQAAAGVPYECPICSGNCRCAVCRRQRAKGAHVACAAAGAAGARRAALAEFTSVESGAPSSDDASTDDDDDDDDDDDLVIVNRKRAHAPDRGLGGRAGGKAKLHARAARPSQSFRLRDSDDSDFESGPCTDFESGPCTDRRAAAAAKAAAAAAAAAAVVKPRTLKPAARARPSGASLGGGAGAGRGGGRGGGARLRRASERPCSAAAAAAASSSEEESDGESERDSDVSAASPRRKRKLGSGRGSAGAAASGSHAAPLASSSPTSVCLRSVWREVSGAYFPPSHAPSLDALLASALHPCSLLAQLAQLPALAESARVEPATDSGEPPHAAAAPPPAPLVGELLFLAECAQRQRADSLPRAAHPSAARPRADEADAIDSQAAGGSSAAGARDELPLLHLQLHCDLGAAAELSSAAPSAAPLLAAPPAGSLLARVRFLGAQAAAGQRAAAPLPSPAPSAQSESCLRVWAAEHVPPPPPPPPEAAAAEGAAAPAASAAPAAAAAAAPSKSCAAASSLSSLCAAAWWPLVSYEALDEVTSVHDKDRGFKELPVGERALRVWMAEVGSRSLDAELGLLETALAAKAAANRAAVGGLHARLAEELAATDAALREADAGAQADADGLERVAGARARAASARLRTRAGVEAGSRLEQRMSKLLASARRRGGGSARLRRSGHPLAAARDGGAADGAGSQPAEAASAAVRAVAEPEHDSLCGACNDGGLLLCCDGCTCAFHSKCVGLSKPPADDEPWFCDLCEGELAREQVLRAKYASAFGEGTPQTPRVRVTSAGAADP